MSNKRNAEFLSDEEHIDNKKTKGNIIPENEPSLTTRQPSSIQYESQIPFTGPLSLKEETKSLVEKTFVFLKRKNIIGDPQEMVNPFKKM
jgi:hypothetical protein